MTLVAVSKTKPNEAIQEAYDSGHRVFGKTKSKRWSKKHDQLPKDIEWHMIGHLQRNKVKYIASFVSLIHGVDTEKLLVEINKQAHKHNRIIDCLLQIHIAEKLLNLVLILLRWKILWSSNTNFHVYASRG